MTLMAATTSLTSNPGTHLSLSGSLPLFVLLALYLSFPITPGYAADNEDNVVYINDTLRVGIRPKPDNHSTPLGLAVTGDKLEILAREGNYVQVRTDNGIEGWIKKNYVTTSLPSSAKLKQLQEKFKKLNRQLAEMKNNTPADSTSTQGNNTELAQENDTLKEQITLLKKQLAATSKQVSASGEKSSSNDSSKVLRKQLAELQEQNTALSNRLAEAAGLSGSGGMSTTTSMLHWLYWVIIILMSAIIAFIAGGFWFRQRAMRRLGGLGL